MNTKIMSCSCKHQFQDKKYGESMRVHNISASGWRCTVCSKTNGDGKKKK